MNNKKIGGKKGYDPLNLLFGSFFFQKKFGHINFFIIFVK